MTHETAGRPPSPLMRDDCKAPQADTKPVPTNGVAAIKTTGTQDSPIVNPSDEIQILKAEYSNLKSSYDRLKLAYDAWHEKTGWIHKTIKPAELGQHIADVMTKRLRSQK